MKGSVTVVTYAQTAEDAKKKLAEGNERYVVSRAASLDASEVVLNESVHGQKPYAVIIACSDSRVIPEAIFSAGIGDLFVIRVAGNVVDNVQLGSVEYAVEHLGCRLVVVLGHTGCGAVSAALGDNHGHIKHITDEIKRAIGSETDTVKASILNVKQSVAKVQTSLAHTEGLMVCGALYHTDSGIVDFDLQ